MRSLYREGLKRSYNVGMCPVPTLDLQCAVLDVMLDPLRQHFQVEVEGTRVVIVSHASGCCICDYHAQLRESLSALMASLPGVTATYRQDCYPADFKPRRIEMVSLSEALIQYPPSLHWDVEVLVTKP